MRITIFILAVLALAGAVTGVWMLNNAPEPVTQTPQIQTNTTSNSNTATSAVQIGVVNIDDGGKSGTEFGCNDSLIFVPARVDHPTELASALTALFAYRSADTHAYTSLANARLNVTEVNITNAVATVKLTGEYELAGECDGPRFVEQIQQTVEAFPGVDSAVITVNDKPLESVASLKGE